MYKNLLKKLVDIEFEVLGRLNDGKKTGCSKKNLSEMFEYIICVMSWVSFKTKLDIDLEEELSILDERIKNLQLSDEALEDLIRIDRLLHLIMNSSEINISAEENHQEKALCQEILSFFKCFLMRSPRNDCEEMLELKNQPDDLSKDALRTRF